MKRVVFAVLAVAGWALTATHASAQRNDRDGQSTNVTCSSDDGNRHYCNADTSGRVQMTRQRSGAKCREGYSYGSDQRGIWVDHGCRADFAVYPSGGRDWNNNGSGNWNNGSDDRNRNDGNWQGSGRPSAVSSVTCSSDDGGRHYCSADTTGRVRMVNQRSGSKCTLGYSWGYDQRGIWVDHGCRADFSVETGRR